jgi:hypothetical protein
MYKPIIASAIFWVIIALLVAIVFNTFTLVRGAEYAPTIPVAYRTGVRTIHIHCISNCGTYTKSFVGNPDFLEWKDYTGLHDWKEPEVKVMKVLVKEVDERLVITTSILLVFVAGVGFLSGYGARKTN